MNDKQTDKKRDNIKIKIAFLLVLIVVFGYLGIFVSLNGMFENAAEDLTGQAYSNIPSSFKYKIEQKLPSTQPARLGQRALIPSGPIVINGQKDMTISGLKITSTTGDCVLIINSENITIKESEIGPCKERGIHITGGGGHRIYDNYIHVDGDLPTICCNTHVGIHISHGADNIDIQGNVIAYGEGNIAIGASPPSTRMENISVIGNYLLNPRGGNYNESEGRGSHIASWGEIAEGNPNPNRNVIVRNNYLRSGASNAAYADKTSDWIGFGYSDGFLVEDNYLLGTNGNFAYSGAGIIADDSTNVAIISNNVLSNTGSFGIAITSGRNHKVSGNKVLNLNPVMRSGWADAIETKKYYPNSPCGNITISNNIADAVWPDPVTHRGYWDGTGSVDPCDPPVTLTNNTFDEPAYNLLHPINVTNPPPLIPPQPKNCVIDSPYTTQTTLLRCSNKEYSSVPSSFKYKVEQKLPSIQPARQVNATIFEIKENIPLKANICRDLHSESNNDFYVDNSGKCGECNDEGNGTITRPWCTVDRAFHPNKIPHLEGGGKLYIREGTYRFDSMASFGSELSQLIDISGAPQNPTLISSYPGEKPRIYFSDRVQGWEKYTERPDKNIWVIDWKGYLQTNYNGQYLYTYAQGTRAPQLVAIDENPIILFQEINSLKNGWTWYTPEETWADSRSPSGTSSIGTDQFDMDQGNRPTFYYEKDSNDPDFGRLFIWLPDGTNPNNRKVEVSVSPAMPFAFGEKPMNYITIRDLTLRFAGGHFGAIILSGSNNKFENLDSSYNAITGLAGLCQNCVVKNSVFSFNGNSGAGVFGENTIYEGNIIADNNWRTYSIGWHAGGIKIVRHPSTANANFVFRNNLVKNNDGWGLWFDFAGLENMLIEGNVFLNNSLDGIRFEASKATEEKPAMVRNNIFLYNGKGKFGSKPDFRGGIDLTGSQYIIMENNLVYDSPGGITEEQEGVFTLLQNTILNNVFVNVSFPLTIARESATVEGNTANKNIFMNTGPSPYWDNLIQLARGWEDQAAAAAFIAKWEELDSQPMFCYGWCYDWAENSKNFTQWRELGFDTISVMKAPGRFNILNYGVDLKKPPVNTWQKIDMVRRDLGR